MEELQKYKDILKREWEEFKKQHGERGKHLKIPFISIKNMVFWITQDWNLVKVFSQNYDLISLSNLAVKSLQLY